MIFLPSTKLSVYREDEGVDQYGDPVKTRSLVTSGVSGHIYEQIARATDPSSGRELTEREIKAIVNGNHPIRKNDIIEDDQGVTYTVDYVIRYYNPLDKAHSELVLRHIS